MTAIALHLNVHNALHKPTTKRGVQVVHMNVDMFGNQKPVGDDMARNDDDEPRKRGRGTTATLL